MPTVEVVDTPPADYLALVWDEFFVKRGRGVSLDVHFPWIGDCGVFFVVLRDGSEIVGGLAVRPAAGGGTPRLLAGLIGMVCIRADYRGRGLSRLLMSATINEAKLRGMDDLILWTSQPGIYEKSGFEIHDDTHHVTVSISGGSIVPVMPVERVDFQAAVPPFAKRVRQFAADGGVVTIVDAHILAEWSGEESTVACLLAALMPATWQIHALAGDTLPGFLLESGWRVQQMPSALRMIRAIRKDVGPRHLYQLRLLDRI